MRDISGNYGPDKKKRKGRDIIKIYAKSFTYNGTSTKSFGIEMCSFDAPSGYEEVSGGTAVDIDAVKPSRHDKWNFYGAAYSAALSFSVHLMKCDSSEFTLTEQADIARWLIRQDGFHAFVFEDSDYSSILFYAAGTKMSTLNIGNRAVGIKVDFICNSPFGFSMETENIYEGGHSYPFENHSEENGYLYPALEIKVNTDGAIKIHNTFDDRETVIENCIAGETISLDNESKIIRTDSSHDLSNDFNYKWFRIGRIDENNVNTITITGDCVVKMKYQLIRKVGLG